MSVTRSNDVETDGMMLCSVWLWHRVGLKQVPRNIKNYPLPWHVYHQSSIRKSMMMIAIIIITIDSRILFSKYISKYLGTWDLKFPLHCCNSADFVPNQNVLNNTKLKQYPKKNMAKTKRNLEEFSPAKKLVAKDSVSGPIHPAVCWSLKKKKKKKMISRKPSIVEKSFVSPSCTAKGTAPFIQYGKFSCKPPSTSWRMLICLTNVLLMLPSSLSCN